MLVSRLAKLGRVSIALGGFLIFLGVVMVIVCALTYYELVIIPEVAVFFWVLLMLSLLNLIGGLLLTRNCRWIRMIRQTLVTSIGLIQVMIGVSSIVFSYIFHYELFGFQIFYNLSPEEKSLYLVLFLAIGLFSLISGILFIQEWRDSI